MSNNINNYISNEVLNLNQNIEHVIKEYYKEITTNFNYDKSSNGKIVYSYIQYQSDEIEYIHESDKKLNIRELNIELLEISDDLDNEDRVKEIEDEILTIENMIEIKDGETPTFSITPMINTTEVSIRHIRVDIHRRDIKNIDRIIRSITDDIDHHIFSKLDGIEQVFAESNKEFFKEWGKYLSKNRQTSNRYLTSMGESEFPFSVKNKIKHSMFMDKFSPSSVLIIPSTERFLFTIDDIKLFKNPILPTSLSTDDKMTLQISFYCDVIGDKKDFLIINKIY